MRKTVEEHLAEYARTQPDKVAVIVDDVRTTYKELFELVCGYCRYLKLSGINKDDIVIVKGTQDLEYVVTYFVTYFAVHLCNAIISPVGKAATLDNIMTVVDKLKAKAIISDEYDIDEVVKIPRGNVLDVAREHYSEDFEYTFPKLEDTADIVFTTGTTGASKGVEIGHLALVAATENLIYGCEYKKDTVIIVPGPLNHVNAIRKMITTISNGSSIYILNGMLSVKAFFKALDYNEGSMACCLAPALVRKIFQVSEDKIGEYAHKIDFIESASAPLPEADKQRLCKLLPNTRLYNNYGSSESASICMYNYNKVRGLVNCIGKAVPNAEIFVVDENKNVIKSSKDNVGYIASRGDMNMKGYRNDPEITSEVLIDGAVYTNDLGYIDEEGYIYIIGRKGDVINVGGGKIAPNEIEATVLEHDSIAECICIGIDDEITGKALKLLYVVKEGKELSHKELKKFLMKKLELYKVPNHYEVIDEVKKTYNGKIDRKAYM